MKKKRSNKGAGKKSGNSTLAYFGAALGVGLVGYGAYRYFNKKEAAAGEGLPYGTPEGETALPPLPGESSASQGDSGSYLDTAARVHADVASDIVTYPARAVTRAAGKVASKTAGYIQRVTGQVLQRGSKGQQVMELQTALKALGQNIVADGQFGPATQQALANAGYATPFAISQLPELKSKAAKAVQAKQKGGAPIRPGTYTDAELIKLKFTDKDHLAPARWLHDEIHKPKRQNLKNIEALFARRLAPDIAKAYRMKFGTWPHIHIQRLPGAATIKGTIDKIARYQQGLTGAFDLAGLDGLDGLDGIVPGVRIVTTTGTLIKDGSNYRKVKAGTVLGLASGTGGGAVMFGVSNGRVLSVPQSDVRAV